MLETILEAKRIEVERARRLRPRESASQARTCKWSGMRAAARTSGKLVRSLRHIHRQAGDSSKGLWPGRALAVRCFHMGPLPSKFQAISEPGPDHSRSRLR